MGMHLAVNAGESPNFLLLSPLFKSHVLRLKEDGFSSLQS